ncbi:MAG: HD domain-containing protein [Candidatus Cloacimonetes bacterium]|nr:HD domain-containing protein [Candidatus Cloacimonadota bacterium]
MMDKQSSIAELSERVNEEIIGLYLVAEKELRDGKNDQFLRLRLQDRSGSISANVWKEAKKLDSEFDAGDVIKLKANVVSFKGQIQLSITKLRFADKSEYSIEDFLTRSKIEPEVLAERFFSFVDKVEQPYLNKLLHLIFDDKTFFAQYLNAPAAKGWHHNYVHGLIEHSNSVASLCEFASSLYPVNYDLLICGALLHDVAKVREYDSKTSIEFTDVGRLVGHLSMSDQLVCETAARIPGFPDELLLNLRHLILAHHGEYEKASVRLPQTLEALVLHLCDNLDAQSVGVAQMIEAAPPNAVWTEFDKLNSRYYKIYRPIP